MSGSGTNKIVSSLVNEISWITDDASYQKAKKKIISLKAAHVLAILKSPLLGMLKTGTHTGLSTSYETVIYIVNTAS